MSRHEHETVEDESGIIPWAEFSASAKANWMKNAAAFSAERTAQIEDCRTPGVEFHFRDDGATVRVWYAASPSLRVDWWLRSGKARIVGRRGETVYVRKLAGILEMLRA